MTIGEKIKELRIKKKMTQSDLSGDKITRNMLSAIESGKASPSLETLYFIANSLDVPPDYLVSDTYDSDFYLKNKILDEIKTSYASKKYKDCLELAHRITNLDDELYYILASCNFVLGVSAAQFGSLRTARCYLEESLSCCAKTIYDTLRYETVIPMYLAITGNISAPLLEFDIAKYDADMRNSVDYEFYKYLTSDFSYKFTCENYKMHLMAKMRIKERKYTEAIKILREIEDNKATGQYSVYLMLGVYTDLDNCYKQLCDFENAHRYSTKRITLIENLNT